MKLEIELTPEESSKLEKIEDLMFQSRSLAGQLYTMYLTAESLLTDEEKNFLVTGRKLLLSMEARLITRRDEIKRDIFKMVYMKANYNLGEHP